MSIEEFITELKVSLRTFDKRDLIDEVSVYRWVELALKKFGGDISMPKDVVLDLKQKQAVMPGDYYDLILAYKCDFAGYEIPEGDKIIPELQNTLAWKERTERSYRWCSCDECCKDECERTIIEKFYINTHDRDHEVRCYYNKPVKLKLSRPMLKDMCLAKYRNMYDQESPYEINIVNGTFYANFDGPVYIKYKALPFDGKGDIFIPDTPLGGLADYVDTYVRMKLFEEWMYNGEVQGAADMFKLYLQQEPIKFRTTRTELKMSNLRLEDLYEPLRRRKKEISKYEVMYPLVDQVIKLI